ncbi:hypothetical protein HpCK65_13240 [Helicobacter pylori]
MVVKSLKGFECPYWIRTEPLFSLRNKACLDPHAILNPYGKVRILGENMEKTETTIFVDWQNLLTDLIAI